MIDSPNKSQHRLLTILIFSAVSMMISIDSSYACGGFFCNSNNPVNQSAERILFAQHTDEGKLEMHIQIQYAGPPTDFGWILPTSPDVETTLSSESLFSALDRLFGPVFILNYNYDGNCPRSDFQELPSENGVDGAGGGGVQVLSREAVGPYDRAILAAESVEELRTWLDENQFQIPESFDDKLQPYVEAGAAFVVIKLLPGQDSGDIVPLRLTFSGTRPNIPILPTGVAATPDMGVIVHMLADHRSIPVNYRHVVINEAAIDWSNQGINYADVVSQAADEAGGQAFTTDFAGEHEGRVSDVLTPYTDNTLSNLAMARTVGELINAIDDRTNPDFQRVAAAHVEIPEGVTPAEFFRCANCYDDGSSLPVDGAAVADQLRQEVNPAYEAIGELFGRLPYLTRLYTTMSAEEMTNDPMFSTNPDMDDVSNIHTAEINIVCDEEGETTTSLITLSDGREIEGEPIMRQEGETVRGEDQNAAARIEQTFEAGQPEVLTEMTETNNEEMMAGMAMEGGSESTDPSAADEMTDGKDTEDSGCQQKGHPLTSLGLFLMLIALMTKRQGLV